MKRILFFIAWGCMLVFSCSDNGDNMEPPEDSLSAAIFYFDHTVDGSGLILNDIRYENEAGNRYSVMTLRYYVSDFTFHRHDGSFFKKDVVHYRDVDLPETHALRIDSIPDGAYASVSFIFGIDSVKNESYSLPPTQENNNMEWPEPMGGGYHYMKFEGRYVKETGEMGSFNTHTGRLKTHDGAVHENFVAIELPYSAIRFAGADWHVQILMNLNEWYARPYVYDIDYFGPAIMDNQAAQQTLKENGRDAFTIGYRYAEK